MKWADFKQSTVGELIDFTQALADASTIENGPAQSGVLWKGEPIEEVARTMTLDFLDNGIFRFKEGSIGEITTDTGLNLVDNQVDWVDMALRLVRSIAPWLDAKPLAALPI